MLPQAKSCLKSPAPNNTRSRAPRGFTILEMMIALVVLGVSLIGMAQLLGVALQQNYFARFNTVAAEMARGKLEELKARYDAQLSTGVASSSLVAGQHGPETITIGDTSGGKVGLQVVAVTWSVVDLAGFQKRVTVTVKPQNVLAPEAGTMKRKTVTMTGLFAP